MNKDILREENIQLHVDVHDKEAAIRHVGEILVNNGYITNNYINKMIKREEIATTYIGNQVAIPHGTEDSRDEVQQTGIAVITVPNGIDFGDNNIAKVIIGIAGKGDEHLEVLSNIAIVCSEEVNVQRIIEATSKQDILNMFTEVN